MTEAHLLVFAKAPQPGRVKTRLVPPLTPEEAAAVHEACLRDVIAAMSQTGARLRIVYDDVPGAAAYFAGAFPELEIEAQSTGDLGQRMAEAFSTRFAEGAESVIVVGADSPTLPMAYVLDGLVATREDGGAIGPAADGGYYLIGLRRDAWPPAAALFDNIPWSTERVFARTLERAAAIGLRLQQLPHWYDIDRFDDLELARAHAAADSQLARLLDAGEVGVLRRNG